MKFNFLSRIEWCLTLVYVCVGGCWIAFSDILLLYVTQYDLEKYTSYQTFKGWFYVLLTAVLLFFLLKKYRIKKEKLIQQIEYEKKIAEKESRLKTIFLQNISHEIRTPTNAIAGFAEIMKNYLLEPEKKEQYQNIIYKNALRLLNFLQNLLDLSKLQTNELVLIPQSFQMKQFYDEFLEDTQNLLPDQIFIHLVKGVPETKTFVTDFRKLKQLCLLFTIISIQHRGKGNPKIMFLEVENNLSIDIHWEQSLLNSAFQKHIDDFSFITHEILAWDIVTGFVRLFQGTISVHQFQDSSYRFLITIPLSKQTSI